MQLQGPREPFPEQATLVDLVEEQVDRTPDALALVDGEVGLTYAELEVRANRLAWALLEAGVGPDVPAGVLLERSPALAVALLATLKAGGACLPLDPAQPPLRLAQMLDDAAPPVLVTAERLREQVSRAPARVILMDRDGPELATRPDTRPPRRAGPPNLAYLIYTSGSTGEPKGVMLPHRGLVNHNVAVARLYGLGPGDRVVQFCSIGFDVSIEEIFPTWESGATLVLRPADAPILGRSWLEWLRRARVTVLNLPTAYWHEWVRDLERLDEQVPACVRLVIVGGEKALGSAYETWLRVGGDGVRWLNAYGPAETSVLATAYEPAAGSELVPDRDPPIGRPLANTTVEIMGADRDGVGELVIGGAGVARGYLGRPELTAERFVTDPGAGRDGERRYRTGDLVRLLEDGNLEFVGRVDEQVKVRGFRIEPGEVESVLTRHPEVAEAAVVMREETPGEKRLVAYVVQVGGAHPTSAGLRRFISGHLPAYMVPSAFLFIPALPMTPHGKVARDALPPPDEVRRAPRAGAKPEGPRTPAEHAIAAIFARVLGLAVAAVGVEDDFFELGGHSLQAMQVLAAVHNELGARIGVGALYAEPTVAGLAAAVQAAQAPQAAQVRENEPPALRPRRRAPEEPVPLTLSQEQMWRLETTADPPGLFNVTAQHRFSEPVDAGALRRALAYMVERHEALRARFERGPGGPYQLFASSLAVDVALCDLTEVAAAEREEALRRTLGEQDAEAFDLARGPLLRACLYRLGPEHSVLAASFDHLVCDGTSAYVFLSELTAAYEAFAAGREPALRPLTVQYADYALWQRCWLTEERLERQLEYWTKKLAGIPWGPAVPFDRVPERPSRHIVARDFDVGPDTYRGMQRLARANHSTVFIVTVAAVQELFRRAGGVTDVVLSTTLSGRRLAEVDGLVGCFHGVGRIRTDLSGAADFEEVVARTRETVIGLIEHQDVPFWRIRRAVLGDFPTGGSALLAAVPIELQYFHTAHDEWAPGAGVVERPGPDKGPDELFFRGHLHPLQVSILDDGSRLWGQFSYKSDFYDAATIDRLAGSLERLLAEVTREAGPRLPVATADPSAASG
ncbi:MAG TPA: amino acid adenylation domain-containing protein [Solirubrobacteraceae bacterium]|nr:amino acid adenylation domain-containing protein [Solirubrobacteraceae bacterium]